MMSEIVRIAKELSDEELIIHMTELNRISKGIIPENLYILTNELIQRFDKHKFRDTYTLKEVCEIAGITAEDLINADTPEIEC